MAAPERHDFEVPGLGTVSFRALGQLAVRQVQEGASREAVRVAGANQAQAEVALLIGAADIQPQLSNEAVARVFGDQPEVLWQLADAIRAVSWPNR